MPSTSRSGLSRAATVVVICALALTACGTKDDAPSKADPGESPASSTASTPVETPADDLTTPAPGTPTPTEPATLSDRLVPTAEVPGLNAKWHWEDGATGPAGDAAFGLCAKVDLVSIGATEVVERTYFPPVDTDDNAAEQLAEFPDATTTATALKVLQSWRQKCATKTRKVGPLVAVDGGSWYLVTSTPPNKDDGLFQAVGLVTNGNRIAVLTIDALGQDYNYPAGQEPMVGMVRAAADRLG